MTERRNVVEGTEADMTGRLRVLTKQISRADHRIARAVARSE